MSPHIQEVWDCAAGANLSRGKDGLSKILSSILSEKSLSINKISSYTESLLENLMHKENKRIKGSLKTQ